MKYKRKRNDPFSTMQNVAIGNVGLGVTTAVGAGIAANAPAGTPSLTGGFSTIASFAPVAGTAMIGRSIIKSMKKKKY